MKQSTLNFAAAKRTASNSYAQVGKPKLTSSTTVPKSKTFTKATINKRESTDDDIDDYDDVVIKESSGEEIEEVESVDSKLSKVDATDALKISSVEDNETLTRKSRSQTKKSQPSKPGKEKGSNVETASQCFKPEDVQKKVEELPELDPSDKRWNKLHKAAKVKLGGVPGLFRVFCATLRH